MTIASFPSALPTQRERRARPSTRKKLDRLLMKAAALIAEKGFAAMTMRDLGAALDMSLAGLYHYFANKEDLLFQLQYRTFGALLEQQEKIAAQPGMPAEQLCRLVTGHLLFFARHTHELKACTFELESLDSEHYRVIEEIRRRYYRMMTSVIAAVIRGPTGNARETRQDRHATLFVFGMLNWIFMWYSRSRHGPVDRIGEEMCALILHGLEHRRSTTNSERHTRASTTRTNGGNGRAVS